MRDRGLCITLGGRVRCSEQNIGLTASPSSSDAAAAALAPPSLSSSDDNVRRREEDGDGGDDGERGEGDEAEPVDHHRGELTHAHAQKDGEEEGREQRRTEYFIDRPPLGICNTDVPAYSDTSYSDDLDTVTL